MSNQYATRAGTAWFLGYAPPVFAFTDGAATSEVLIGPLVMMGFVVLVYGLVFLVKYLSGSKDLGPDKLTAVEFDEYTRSSDDPSLKFPNTWPRRK